MNSMFKGILIGILTSALLLLLVKILFYSDTQPVPTNMVNQNNNISVKPLTENGKTPEKRINNTQIKQSNNSSGLPTKSDEYIRQQAEREKLTALDSKYAQMEIDLSEQILDLRQQLSNLPIELKEKLSYINDEAEVTRVSEEARREAERIQKQILGTNEKLTLIKAKRQLLPLTTIREK